MKKITKALLLTAACGLFLPVMSACNPGDDGKVHIKFWHTMGKELQASLNNMITLFNEQNPDIVIEHDAQGGYPDLFDKVCKAIPAGTTPTMAYCYPDHVAQYNSSKAIINIEDTFLNKDSEYYDPYTEEDGLVDDIIKVYWEEGQQYLDKGMYSVPYSKSSEAMFYNKDIFDKYSLTVPTTWESMETLMADIVNRVNPAEKEAFIKAGGKAEDWVDVVPLGYDSDANLFITMCEQYGIPYTSLNREAKTGSADFNNDAAKAMVTKLADWYAKGYIKTQGTSNGAYTSTEFTENKLYMTIGSTGGTGYNYTSNFKVGTAAVPGPDKTNPFHFGGDETKLNDHLIMQGPSICFFKKATQDEKKAAWKFYKFITRTTCTAQFSVASGYSPIRNSAFTCDAMQEYLAVEQPGKAGLIQTTVRLYSELPERYYISPAFKGSSACRTQVEGIIARAFMKEDTLKNIFDQAYSKAQLAIE